MCFERAFTSSYPILDEGLALGTVSKLRGIFGELGKTCDRKVLLVQLEGGQALLCLREKAREKPILEWVLKALFCQSIHSPS